MNLQQPIVRHPLLNVPLGQWSTTGIDVRRIHFAASQKTGRHTHPCPVVGYIVQGSAILEVEGGAPQSLEAGAAFYEPAGVRILRFDNASATSPLQFIAVYLLKGNHPLIEMLD